MKHILIKNGMSLGLVLIVFVGVIGWPGLAEADVQCTCTRTDGSGITDTFTTPDGPSCSNYPLPSWTCTPTSPTPTPTDDASFVPLAPIPGLTEGITPDQKGVAAFLNNLYIFAIGIAVILAIGMIIWGGAEIALNRGSVSTVMDGKGKIAQALLGLLLVLSPALVFSIINPAILNLEVNMPALKTPWGTFGTSPGCTDPNGCSTAPAVNSWVSQNQYQGFLPCEGSDCSKAASACKVCKLNGTRSLTGSATAVCGNSSTKKYTGGITGVETAPNSCPEGSSSMILCTLYSGPVLSGFFLSC